MSGQLGLLALGACLAASCGSPLRQHSIIDAYKAAECLTPLEESRVQPPVREWEAIVRPAGGAELSISGAQVPSGVVIAVERQTGTRHVVASAGDYVYPADVRILPNKTRVFVKADGMAGGMRQETWLFEYDLVQFRQIDKVLVDPSVLPSECPGGPRTPKSRKQ